MDAYGPVSEPDLVLASLENLPPVAVAGNNLAAYVPLENLEEPFRKRSD